MRHALRNYGNPRALRRNPLKDAPGIAALAERQFSDNWNEHVAALRHAIACSVDAVLASADEADRHALEVVLRGVMQGRTIGAIAGDLSYSREWLHKTWWTEAVRAVTAVMLQRYLRVPDESAGDASLRPAVLRPAG